MNSYSVRGRTPKFENNYINNNLNINNNNNYSNPYMRFPET